ncbi:retrovirus-related pol polyprotein from transposon TNT 1-94 [Tanacetum coccineum]
MIMDPFTKKVLWDFWIIKDGQEGVANKEFSNAEKANNDYEQETAKIYRIETNLFNYETPTKTYEDYENKLNDELEEPWSEDGVPYEIYDHICEPFRFKNRKAKWSTCNSNEDGFCNGGELLGMVRRNHIQGPYTNYYINYEDEERYELFDDQERPVCNIRRFEMIKYSFGKDEEYVAIKEHEYDDLTKSTNEDACRTYQEIFHMMDEGWMAKKESSNEECSTFGSEEKSTSWRLRDFKKFFKRRGRFGEETRNDKKTFKEAVMIRNYGEEDDEKVKDETCLVAHASSKICLRDDWSPTNGVQGIADALTMMGHKSFLHLERRTMEVKVSIFGSNLREPKNVNEALGDESWIVAINKLDENGIVSQNKARLVTQGYNQQEGIDYDEIYAPVARLESIRILLAYAYALDFKLFQMDVKSAFLNGFINEEVYMTQPSRFIDFEKPDHVYKLKKALYSLKQAPKAWYDRLKVFLIKHEYKIGMVDNTLFTKKKSSNLIIVQIYVDDIIFGSTCQDMCDEFAKIMHDEFKMSMMGKLNFFLRLQIKQMKDGILINQSNYIKEMLQKFSLEDSKPMKTPMSSDTKLIKDEECESVDSTKY